MRSNLSSRLHQFETQPVVRPDGRFSIDCGGTVVAVESPSLPWREAARARYDAFVCSDSDPEIVIHHSEDEAAMIAEHGYKAHVEETGRGARFGSAEGTDLFDGVLRTLLPSVIAPDLMAHGALLIDGLRGLLCCGVSGSGKSTMAAMFPDIAVCDELTRVNTGHDGIEARSLPFWEARPATAPLRAVFILEHGAEHRRVLLEGAEAMREMRRHVYWPLDRPDLTLALFETLALVCEEIPVYRLAFRPERSVLATMVEGLG